MSNENLVNVFNFLDTRKSGYIDHQTMNKYVDLGQPLGHELSFDEYKLNFEKTIAKAILNKNKITTPNLIFFVFSIDKVRKGWNNIVETNNNKKAKLNSYKYEAVCSTSEILNAPLK